MMMILPQQCGQTRFFCRCDQALLKTSVIKHDSVAAPNESNSDPYVQKEHFANSNPVFWVEKPSYLNM